jgi:ATP-binding cassette subfamily B protein
MDKGRIVERGTHAQLLGQGGRYADMWQLQQSGSDAVAAPEAVADV